MDHPNHGRKASNWYDLISAESKVASHNLRRNIKTAANRGQRSAPRHDIVWRTLSALRRQAEEWSGIVVENARQPRTRSFSRREDSGRAELVHRKFVLSTPLAIRSLGRPIGALDASAEERPNHRAAGLSS